MTKKTYVKEAKKAFCNLTLTKAGISLINHGYLENADIINSEIFKELVLLSPSGQSNMGIKLSKKISKHNDELVNDITKDLGAKSTYFFASYESKKTEKIDLSKKIANDNDTYLCLYCSDNFAESIFKCIRNALAHGNIISSDGDYYLYSIAKGERGESGDDDSNKKLEFLLKIRDLKKLDAYMRAFRKYN